MPKTGFRSFPSPNIPMRTLIKIKLWDGSLIKKHPGGNIFSLIGGWTHCFTILFSYWFSITTIKNPIVSNPIKPEVPHQSYFFGGSFSNRKKGLIYYVMLIDVVWINILYIILKFTLSYPDLILLVDLSTYVYVSNLQHIYIYIVYVWIHTYIYIYTQFYVSNLVTYTVSTQSNRANVCLLCGYGYCILNNCHPKIFDLETLNYAHLTIILVCFSHPGVRAFPPIVSSIKQLLAIRFRKLKSIEIFSEFLSRGVERRGLLIRGQH